ncbi:hypothetical protein NSP_20160 [Nodularia spumigena CCY9414]|nr:hypothetical protein NSP_20160 [Nodularia spumigena CCY9414]
MLLTDGLDKQIPLPQPLSCKERGERNYSGSQLSEIQEPHPASKEGAMMEWH